MTAATTYCYCLKLFSFKSSMLSYGTCSAHNSEFKWQFSWALCGFNCSSLHYCSVHVVLRICFLMYYCPSLYICVVALDASSVFPEVIVCVIRRFLFDNRPACLKIYFLLQPLTLGQIDLLAVHCLYWLYCKFVHILQWLTELNSV